MASCKNDVLCTLCKIIFVEETVLKGLILVPVNIFMSVMNNKSVSIDLYI